MLGHDFHSAVALLERWLKHHQRNRSPICPFPHSDRTPGGIVAELRSDPVGVFPAGIWESPRFWLYGLYLLDDCVLDV